MCTQARPAAAAPRAAFAICIDWLGAGALAAPFTLLPQGSVTLCGPVPAGRMTTAICRNFDDKVNEFYLVNPCEEVNGTQHLCGSLTAEAAKRG